MISITENTYREVAKSLLKSIDNSSFFNGTIEFDTAEFYCSLRTTLIIYRTQNSDKSSIIDEIVPVWWEFSLTTPSGQATTDFSWRELKTYLI